MSCSLLRRVILLILLSICFVAHAEPTNLSVTKQKLKQYHDSGQYKKECQQVINDARSYISTRLAENSSSPHPRQLAIIFDIDETVLSNYNDMLKLHFGGTLASIDKEINKGHDPAIKASLNLFNYARQNNIAVFFITGRHEYERSSTTSNLKHVGFHDWQGLILKPNNLHVKSASDFKAPQREKITAQGYVIVASIGDQVSDFSGGYTERGFKLPNPYYYLP